MKLNKKVIVRTALSAVLVSALGYSFVAKSETKLIPFQGKLTDASGQVISDGAIVVQFKMYDAPVGGQAKWNGEVQMLSVNSGLVNTTLGTKASLKNVDFSTPTYLEITIDANGDNEIGPEDPPLLPRQSIIPAVYAVEAGNSKTMGGHDWSAVFSNGDPSTGKINGNKLADQSVDTKQIADNAVTSTQIKEGAVTTVQVADGAITMAKLEKELANIIQVATPPGTIIAFGGENVPEGWFSCDGRALSSKDYPALYQAIGKSWGSGITLKNGEQVQSENHDFNLPELHGVFLRGWNSYMKDTRINDPDAGGRYALILGGSTGNHVGSFQEDAIQVHGHKVYMAEKLAPSDIPTQRKVPAAAAGAVLRNPFSRNDSPTEFYAAEEVSVSADIPVHTSRETRPKNAYVNYIIKY